MRDDFHFSGPMMEAHNPEELFAQMKDFGCDFKNRVLHMIENGQTVAVLVDCDFSRPFQATILMSEWFTVVDGKIVSSTLVYDTRQTPSPDAA